MVSTVHGIEVAMAHGAAPLSPVVGLGLLAWIAIAFGVVVGGVALFLAAAALLHDRTPVRDQRPFHICPECKGYNSRDETVCWRCSHDLTKAAIEPSGELGLRLAKLDSPKS
jgi:hypothetical protein